VTAGTATPAGEQRPVTAAEVLEALVRHYRKPGADRDGEILIPEVRAPGSGRRADLVCVGVASRGYRIDVHEVKVTRADWLRELADPAKAEAWWHWCHQLWVVTPPGIVHDGELPPGWGLMELPPAGRRRFRIRVQAVTRDEMRPAMPLVVELLRRADNMRLAEIDQIRRQHRDDVAERDARWRREASEAKLAPEVKHRLDALTALEAALGMPVNKYAGWPAFPVADVTPLELAAFLADAREHVAVQRRASEVNGERQNLRRTARDVLERLAATEEAR
jgi:hypothetical protein